MVLTNQPTNPSERLENFGGDLKKSKRLQQSYIICMYISSKSVELILNQMFDFGNHNFWNSEINTVIVGILSKII